MFKTKQKIIQVKGLSEKERNEIKTYLQGQVYSFCKQKKNSRFFLRDLLGGENYFWQKTPVFCLYQRQLDAGKDHRRAFNQAAKDAGKLLKWVLDIDKREFIVHRGWRLSYEWTLVEDNSD